MRNIRRLIYDENYQQALNLTLDIIEKQQNTIDNLVDIVANLQVKSKMQEFYKIVREHPDYIIQKLDEIK